jgi:hypothetical protein
MQHLQYQHLNASKYVSVRYMQVADGEYDRYCDLRKQGYSITTEHDGYDRILLTVESNRGYLPKYEKICSYADRDAYMLKSISVLHMSVMQDVQVR